MKAAVLTKYTHFEWHENLPVPQPGDNDVLVRVAYAGICGSDMHIFNGDFASRTRLPLIPGHEFSGVVDRVGKDVKSFKIGEKVVVDPIIWCGKCAACQRGHYPACSSLKLIGIDMDGGFGEYVCVHQSMLYKMPDSVSLLDAALMEIYSIGFHACKRAGLQKNDTVVIWGSGRIGQAILQAARTITSNTIFCVDILHSRLINAKSAYPDIITINTVDQDPIKCINEMTQNRGVDIAFEAVGHAKTVEKRPNPVQGCIKAIRGAGTVCVLGLGDVPSPVLTKALIWKEATIVASRVSHGEFSEAINHLNRGVLKPDSLVSKVFDASEVQQAFELLHTHPENYLKVILKL